MGALETDFSALASFALTTGADVVFNEPMSKHTTFQIGGPAAVFIRPEDEESLQKISTYCIEQQIPMLALGHGSNMLLSDRGFAGAVIALEAFSSIRVEENDVICGAGAMLSAVCRFACKHGLSGLEFAYGIPGTVGGAVFMNAGAYGGEMQDVVKQSCYLDGKITGHFEGPDHQFSYRHSVYSGTKKLITQIRLHLTPGEPEKIEARMQELMGRRRDKQPLNYPSAGSVFKRPVGHYAGTLIERCGLKGTQIGGAMVSDKHAGFIVNVGGATCEDVRTLVHKIQDTVLARTGVRLESEIRIIGTV